MTWRSTANALNNVQLGEIQNPKEGALGKTRPSAPSGSLHPSQNGKEPAGTAALRALFAFKKRNASEELLIEVDALEHIFSIGAANTYPCEFSIVH